MNRIWIRAGVLPAVALALVIGERRAAAQGPTVDAPTPLAPGSSSSLLGNAPGGGAEAFEMIPGSTQGTLGGRPGAAATRVSPSLSTPPVPSAIGRESRGMGPTPVLPAADLPIYGSLELPTGEEAEGPPDGLSLDQAIELLVRNNLDLRAKNFELPQADADILTAGLRANPIFYADAQLVPYGQYTRDRPGGQTQYDVNISYPLDLSRKRQSRVLVANKAKRVLEAQYTDAVRLSIANLYTAFVDVLAARVTVELAQASVDGLQRAYEPALRKFEQKAITEAELKTVQNQLKLAQLGLRDFQSSLRKAKETLAALLNLRPGTAASLDLRGRIRDNSPPPPSGDALIRIGMENRPDLIAFRLGIDRAIADVRLARANRFQDVYVLYQPYTLQDNTPFGMKSPTSWALGVTVPMPLYNRNQGNIQRAKINVGQTQTELAAMERQVVAEIARAESEYHVTRNAVEEIENELIPGAQEVLRSARVRYESGQEDVVFFLTALRDFNDVVRQYRDSLVRHRRSMLDVNTAVGRRILP
jgi:cobalt-zinc-cadmium efflux system outer membrane protein